MQLPTLRTPARRFLRSAIASAVALAAITTVAAKPIEVEISMDDSGDATRLVLKHDRKAVFAVISNDERVEVVYAEPVTVEPESGRVGSVVLQEWALYGDRSLRFFTGPEYAGYDHFELNNPHRVVLDLRRKADPIDAPPGPDYAPQRPLGPVVVVDPGHGGIEHGAVGPTGLMEKEVALDIARRLRSRLGEMGVNVVLTRDGDRHVPLDDRTAIANHNRADLFVSIHLNASRRKDASGAETYFMSTEATDDEARRLAGLENSLSRPATDSPELRDRGLDLVLWDLAQNRYLAESSALAEEVQRELNTLTGTRDRGVRQAPFRVLVGATMPAILVEAGFISNPDEERAFAQPGYRDRTASAIATAVKAYLDKIARMEGGARGFGAAGGEP